MYRVGGSTQTSRYRMAAASSTPVSSQGHPGETWKRTEGAQAAQGHPGETWKRTEGAQAAQGCPGETWKRTEGAQAAQGRPGETWKRTEGPQAAQRLAMPEVEQGGQAAAHDQQQEQHVSPYVLITPNAERRNQLQQIAKKELDDLKRWKEDHRPGSIKLTPQRLGGKESEDQARQKQQMVLMQSKYQQKHKREEYIRTKKAAEEAEYMRKKAIQREKAEKLEAKKRQDEVQRRKMYSEDQYYKTNELLNRLDLGLPKSDSCQIANRGPESTAWTRSHTYKQALREDENRRLKEMKQEQRRKAELMEIKQKQEEEARTRAHQNEQKRVNSAFLDRLQNKMQANSICQPEYLRSRDDYSNS